MTAAEHLRRRALLERRAAEQVTLLSLRGSRRAVA